MIFIKILEIAQEILDIQGSSAKIVEIYKTGSQIFKDNPKDFDYVVLCVGFKELRKKFYPTIDGHQYDIMMYDVCTMEDQFNFKKSFMIHYNVKLYNYCFCIREIVYGDAGVKWDMFEFENDYKEYLKDMYLKTLGRRVGTNRATKGWSHFYIVLKIYENKSLIITEEMRYDLKRLHTPNEDVSDIIHWVENKLGIKKEEKL